MRHAFAAAVLLSVATFAVAAPPASQPTTAPAGESYPALRKRTADLVKENTDLKQRVSELLAKIETLQGELNKTVAEAGKPKRALGKTPSSIEELEKAFKSDVKVGQSADDVTWILGKPNETMKRGSGPVWYYQQNSAPMVVGNMAVQNKYVVTIYFDASDRVIRFSDEYLR